MDFKTHTVNLISAGATTFRGIEELDDANRELGWTMEYRQIESGRVPAIFLMAEHEGMILSGESFGARVHIFAQAPCGAVSFVVPVAGRGVHRAQRHTFSEDDMLFFPPGSEMNLVTSCGAGDLTLTVPEARFRQAAANLFPTSNLLTDHDGRIVPRQADQLDVVRAGVTAALLGRFTDIESLSELLDRCIAFVAGSVGTVDEKLVRNDARGKVVARALEFIESRFAEPILLDDLCRHAGVGVRVLQRTFRERLDVSPTQYIKVRRLNAARRLLASGAPPETTVSEVALRCGYAHLGRFSVDYRSHFGESPRQSLRR